MNVKLCSLQETTRSLIRNEAKRDWASSPTIENLIMSEPFRALPRCRGENRPTAARMWRRSDLDLPCEDEIVAGNSAMAQALTVLTISGKRVGNRWAIHPDGRLGRHNDGWCD